MTPRPSTDDDARRFASTEGVAKGLNARDEFVRSVHEAIMSIASRVAADRARFCGADPADVSIKREDVVRAGWLFGQEAANGFGASSESYRSIIHREAELIAEDFDLIDPDRPPLVVSNAAFDQLIEMLEHPPEPNPRLVEAVRAAKAADADKPGGTARRRTSGHHAARS